MRRIALIFVVMPTVVACGCSGHPSERSIIEQLGKHEVFAEPVVWYLHCFGTQTRQHELDCLSGLDSQAERLGLTSRSDLHFERMLLSDGSVTWVESKDVGTTIASGGKPVVPMIAPNGQRGWIPKDRVDAAIKAGLRTDDDPKINDDEPALRIALTDRGRAFAQTPGTVLKENEIGFVVGHRIVLSVSKTVRLGPDSFSAEFQWRVVPTEVGKLFEPTLGVVTRTSKALFRLDDHKNWVLMDPRSWESPDPKAVEFDLYRQTMPN